jgi:DNA (cytosine-5)-methyltransferase 1
MGDVRRPHAQDRPETLTAVSLFAGAGGLDLGAVRAGLQIELATDILEDARTSYRRLMPDAEFQTRSIQNLTKLPRADVLLGGYPCQPFSMGGHRRPTADRRSDLFEEFVRCLGLVRPRYFIAENVPGLARLHNRELLEQHLAAFSSVGDGYTVTYGVVHCENYGVPQRRRRLIMVGVRADQGTYFHFPAVTHTADGRDGTNLHESHGDVIGHLEPWPVGEFYEHPEWPWYYMSRNRRASWELPSYTILANARHTPIHPASPAMQKVWSDLAHGSKQGWDFTSKHDHLNGHPDRMVLDKPRRLSWQECALIQTFPTDFEPAGSLMRKVELIGNAVPPLLAEAFVSGLVRGDCLRSESPENGETFTLPAPSMRANSVPVSPGRRRIMQGNRSTDTKPEVRLRSEVHRLGLRYRKHYRIKLRTRWVKVDIAFTKSKVAIFVHGCFWHQCPEHGHLPSSNGEYWLPKLARNVERDKATAQELRSLGWTVVEVWEHEDPAIAAKRIHKIVKAQ